MHLGIGNLYDCMYIRNEHRITVGLGIRRIWDFSHRITWDGIANWHHDGLDIGVLLTMELTKYTQYVCTFLSQL
jgi:hypothetical protein